MPEPYYQDAQATLYLGHALDVLQSLPAESVDCVVTSPPYFGLRDYGVGGQLGAEESPAEFVDALVAVLAEARRALAGDGTLWLNLGDSYASGGRKTYATLTGKSAGRGNPLRRPPSEMPGKNLLGIPWRTAIALQGDGWILRNDVIWAKPNGMPESVTDRLSTKHEHLFLFAKSRRYWFDLDPIREALAHPDAADGSRVFGGKNKADELRTGSSARRTGNRYGMQRPGDNREQSNDHDAADARGRNPGDVWTIPTQPFSEAHFAVFPLEVPRRAIAAGCKPGGTVLDPFSGSGTTGLAASELGRKYIGIDLNRDYLDLSLRTRLAQPSLTAEAPA
ncbi:MAG TPA: site-specific DNA-methyltransferase [Propionicimonas sp.]|nr:site-specific DNA-methyltransferase [Propionicimonas sp.]